jgi:hypothetical protein
MSVSANRPTQAETEAARGRLSAEELALVERAAPFVDRFRDAVFNAASVYALIYVLYSHEEDAIRQALQELVSDARGVEEVGIYDPVQEILPENLYALDGAIEDSLVLSLSTDVARRDLRINQDDLGRRAEIAGRELLGDGWEHYWDELWKDVQVDVAEFNDVGRRFSGEEWVDRSHDEILRFLKGAYAKDPAEQRMTVTMRLRGRRGRIARVDQLAGRINEVLTAALGFYKELAPDGRRLTGENRQDATAHLLASAAALRIVDIEQPNLDAEHYRDHLAPWIWVSRSVCRSMVLALADDPALRAHAMPVQELQQRAQRAGRQVGLLPDEETAS